MILLPCALEQRLIGCLLNQGVLEDDRCLGWHSPLVEQFGVDELRQSVLQGLLVQW